MVENLESVISSKDFMSEEMKREYELELARAWARADVELYYKITKENAKWRHRTAFVYSFWITVIGTCFAFLVTAFAKM